MLMECRYIVVIKILIFGPRIRESVVVRLKIIFNHGGSDRVQED